MSLAELINGAQLYPDRMAIACAEQICTYGELTRLIGWWTRFLREHEVQPGECVALTGVPSAHMVGLLLALIDQANIALPLLSIGAHRLHAALQTGCADVRVHFPDEDGPRLERCGYGSDHALLQKLRLSSPEPGLVLLTSGSTGAHKASVHRFRNLIENVMCKPSKPLRSLIFLMFDHIGGMNTLLHTLWHGGLAVFPKDRQVETICGQIEQHRVELLPTTPTFLNMMLIAGRYEQYDLSSLRLVTYGTEPMALSTLKALNEALPGLKYKQTYGLTEAGILPTRSEDANSVWMKIGGGKYETRIVDDVLWIRSDQAMLGYLNAKSPFDEDGWLNTGDRVEVRGDFVRILGRSSEIINVGGEKVYPSEVENVILQADNIADAVVSSKASAVTGNLVIATVQTIIPEDPAALDRRVRRHCGQHLLPYKVPVIVRSTAEVLHSVRFKKMRSAMRDMQEASIAEVSSLDG